MTPLNSTDARRRLIDHIAADAVFHGDFTLTSGKKASYYVDLRKVSLDHRVAPLIGQVMLDLIADVPDVAAVGGMTMARKTVAFTTGSSRSISPASSFSLVNSRDRSALGKTNGRGPGRTLAAT